MQTEDDFYIEESKSHSRLPKNENVTDRTFKKLKEREDELNDDIKKSRKKKIHKSRNKFEINESFSYDEENQEEMKNKNVNFKNEGDISGISYLKTEESDEELITDELFRRALKATTLEIDSKLKKRHKSKLKVNKFNISFSLHRKRKKSICIKE